MSKIFLSHLIKATTPVETILGAEVYVYIQIIASPPSEKKVVCLNENENKEFYNCNSSEDLKKTISLILKRYKPFKFEILSIDKYYDIEVSSQIINNFVLGEEITQQKLDNWKLNHNLDE